MRFFYICKAIIQRIVGELVMKKRFLKVYDRFLENATVALIAGIMIIMFPAIILRSVVGTPVIWAEEVARYMFVWLVFIGSAVAVNQKAHIAVDYLTSRLPAQINRWVTLLLNLISIAFFLLVFIIGLQFATRGLATPGWTAPFLRMGWAWGAIPCGSLLIAYNLLRVVLEDFYKQAK